MEEVNLVNEIERLESMYIRYKRVYRRVRFSCCSEQARLAKERKKIF